MNFIKNLFKIILRIIVILIVLVVLWLLYVNLEGAIGNHQNNKPLDLSNISDDEINITYMGDSITNGFYSNSKLHQSAGYRDVVKDGLEARGKKVNDNNFAVGGFTIDDVKSDYDRNVTLGEVNTAIKDRKFILDDSIHNYDDVDNPLRIQDAIKNSDYVIMTVGANDVLKAIDSTDGFKVDFKKLFSIVKEVKKEKLELFKEIHEINPDVQIYDVGIYMAFPFINNIMYRALYPVLAICEDFLFINKPKDNIYKVTIRDNIAANNRGYIDNPDDIHPNQSGHDVIGKEVLRMLNKKSKS